MFDFAIVALSIEAVAALLFGGSGGGGNLMILRLFRLARLLKLVGKVKKLQIIVMGLVRNARCITTVAVGWSVCSVINLPFLFFICAAGNIG